MPSLLPASVAPTSALTSAAVLDDYAAMSAEIATLLAEVDGTIGTPMEASQTAPRARTDAQLARVQRQQRAAAAGELELFIAHSSAILRHTRHTSRKLLPSADCAGEDDVPSFSREPEFLRVADAQYAARLLLNALAHWRLLTARRGPAASGVGRSDHPVPAEPEPEPEPTIVDDVVGYDGQRTAIMVAPSAAPQSSVPAPATETRTILKQGWLEKKGGDTHIDANNQLVKERNWAKGGRRNWKQRWFVLYADGELVYYAEERGQHLGSSVVAKGAVTMSHARWHIQEGGQSSNMLLSLRAPRPARLPVATEAMTRPALLLRHGDEVERRAWVQVTQDAFGCAVLPLLAGLAAAESDAAWSVPAGESEPSHRRPYLFVTAP